MVEFVEFRAEIDRFEGDTAVLLLAGEAEEKAGAGTVLPWPRALLPEGATEGSHVKIRCELDPEGRLRLKERVETLLDQLRRHRR